MHQFQIVLKDFVNWKMDNAEILERFKYHGSSIYDRLEPVYAVLNTIYDMVLREETINEDLETIFQVGLNYLNTQFEVIRIYYETVFDSNCELLESYTQLLGYLLYISDLRSDLEEFEDSVDFQPLNDVEVMLENMIAQRDERFMYAADQLKKAVHDVVNQLDFEYVSIIDIFIEIAANLGIELNNHQIMTIGKDI